MTSQSRFGDSFKTKGGNRMDVLKKSPETPEYVIRSQEIRKLLQAGVRETGGWPAMPDVESLEALFVEARNQVTEVWNQQVFDEIAFQSALWADTLEEAGADEAKIQLLRDPAALDAKIKIHQFGVLEGTLREKIPEAWRELVLIASERQLAELVLVRHWLNNLEKNDKQKIAKKFGFKDGFELDIALDGAAILGKYIDHAYVKQIELADSPGGSVETPFTKAEKQGAKYLYDLDTGETPDVKTFSDVFPFEAEAIAKHLVILADRVHEGLQQKKLGREYQKLPAYLKQMASVYGSPIKDPEVLYKQWTDVFTSFRELMGDGCPIMFIPQQNPSVADAANKVDWEIRFNIRTEQSKKIEASLQPYREIAQALNDSLQEYFEKPLAVPPVFVGQQFTASGPNTNWFTRGEADETNILAHSNAVLDVARIGALPALHKMFGPDSIEQERFEQATLIDNSLHELGHTVASKRDKAVLERVGGPGGAKVIEELKADSTAMKLVLMRIEKEGDETVDYRAQLFAKLGDICDYLKNKSKESGAGKPYYYDGVAIISRLLDRGVLVKDGRYYKIIDDKKAIAAIAEISDEIIERYTTGNPAAIKGYMSAITIRGEQSDIEAFIEQLKG